MGRLGDGKGAELLRNLGRMLQAQKAETPLPVPKPKPTPTIEDELIVKATRRPLHLLPKAPKVKPKQKRAGPAPPQTVIKPRSRAEREQLLASLNATRKAAPTTTSKGMLVDFGEAAFKRLEPARTALDGFTASHLGTSSISEQDRCFVAERMKAGAASARTLVDREDGYFLGYDFGTSTTKVVARYPYGGIDQAFAIDVPATFRSAGQPHLWPTAVWWDEARRRFSLVPEGQARLLDSFKAALLQKCGHRICKGSGVTMEEAATAFLALHLAYCLGAAEEQADQFRLAGVNVGIPVATLTDRGDVKVFERIVRAALSLIPQAADLVIENVRAALASGDEGFLPYTLHAELSGAIAGYSAAPRFYIGGHMIIDCGSATLDMASFDLDQRNRPIGTYGALVENLGADACGTFVEHGATVEDCRQACRYEEHLVFCETLRRRRSMFAQADGSFPYQVILIGGGIHSSVHEPFLAKLEGAFARPFHRPAVAPTLRYDNGCEPGRLILADGLARDPIDLRDVRLPADPPSLPPGPQYIGPEQV